MSNGGGQTAKDESGWSVDTLKEHVETVANLRDHHRLEMQGERDKRLQERFEAQERAVITALESVTVRLAGVNEWRQTVTDILGKAMTRAESEIAFKFLGDKVDVIQSRVTRGEGRGTGMKDLWGWIVAAVIAAIAIGNYLR